VGGEALGSGPQLFGHLGFARVALLRRVAGQHPLDVAVQDRRPQAHAQAGNCTGCGQADTGQLDQFFHIPRKMAVIFGDDDLGSLLQIARTCVVAKAGPQVQHFVFRGGGQGLDRRQRGHEPVEVVQHGADLGLLQHDFRDPHPVRGDALLPGQVVAAMVVIPVQYRR